jgi:hypothetical protein
MDIQRKICNWRDILSTIQSFDLFFWMRIFTCSPAQTHEYYSEIFQIFFADPLNKSSRRWSENKTDVRDSLLIKIRHILFDIPIVIIGISEWLKPQNRWNTTLKTTHAINLNVLDCSKLCLLKLIHGKYVIYMVKTTENNYFSCMNIRSYKMAHNFK